MADGVPGRRPRVIAHRGASNDLAEHTLSAYQRALSDGADGLECDVRLTADSHLVCVHDRRIDRTSNGTGVVSTLPLSELEALDWGSWKHPWGDLDDEAPEQVSEGVLTLEELLGTVRDAGRPVELAIETKHPTRYAGLVERRLLETLTHFGYLGADGTCSPLVRIMSFSTIALRRVHDLAPGVPTVLLMDSWPRLRTALPLAVGITGPSVELLRRDPAYVARMHRRSREVHVWTVDRPEDVGLCLDLDVDVVITNTPGAVLRQVAAASHRVSKGPEAGRG